MKNLYFSADIVSDAGPLKDTNKDAGIILSAYGLHGCMVLAVVCDGLECMINGDSASTYVVKKFSDWFEQELMTEMDLYNNFKLYIKSSLLKIIRQCNADIYSQSRRHKYMGTMIEAFFICENWFCSCGIGDCRTIKVNRMNHSNDSRHNTSIKNGHVISQYIGQRLACKPVFTSGKVRTGDSFIICNFGFWGLLNEWYVSALINKNILCARRKLVHMSIKDMICSIIKRLRDEGEGDNITVVLVICMRGGKGII